MATRSATPAPAFRTDRVARARRAARVDGRPRVAVAARLGDDQADVDDVEHHAMRTRRAFLASVSVASALATRPGASFAESVAVDASDALGAQLASARATRVSSAAAFSSLATGSSARAMRIPMRLDRAGTYVVEYRIGGTTVRGVLDTGSPFITMESACGSVWGCLREEDARRSGLEDTYEVYGLQEDGVTRWVLGDVAFEGKEGREATSTATEAASTNDRHVATSSNRDATTDGVARAVGQIGDVAASAPVVSFAFPNTSPPRADVRSVDFSSSTSSSSTSSSLDPPRPKTEKTWSLSSAVPTTSRAPFGSTSRLQHSAPKCASVCAQCCVSRSQTRTAASLPQVTSRAPADAEALGVEGFIVSTNAASVTWSLCPRRRHSPVSATTSQTTTLVSLPPETSNDPDALNLSAVTSDLCPLSITSEVPSSRVPQADGAVRRAGGDKRRARRPRDLGHRGHHSALARGRDQALVLHAPAHVPHRETLERGGHHELSLLVRVHGARLRRRDDPERAGLLVSQVRLYHGAAGEGPPRCLEPCDDESRARMGALWNIGRRPPPTRPPPNFSGFSTHAEQRLGVANCGGRKRAISIFEKKLSSDRKK